jgi:uncharacterized membrane protein HdeD (DUF308 family)
VGRHGRSKGEVVNTATSTRSPIDLAVAGSLAANVALQLTVFVPIVGDDVPTDAKVVAVLTALIGAIGAWGLRNRRTWGRRTTLVLTILNVLTSLPLLFDPPNGAIAVVIVAITLIGVGVVGLLFADRAKAEIRGTAVAA